jgi:hypothetical protein
MMTQQQIQRVTTPSNSADSTTSIHMNNAPTTPLRIRRRPGSVALAWGVGLVTLTVLATTQVSALSLPKGKVRNVLHGVDLHVNSFVGTSVPYLPNAGSDNSVFDSALNMAVIDETNQSEHEFEMHVGRALDTLRSDYPDILTDQPDFSIYDSALEVVDPSGVKVHGLSSYKNAFRFLHGIVKVLYCPTKSDITFRMCYDKARQCIRIHWNAKVVPREIFGGARTTSYVDGISCYEMDRKTGMITQHRIEKLLMNQTPVRPKEGIYAALKTQHVQSVPSYIQTADHFDSSSSTTETTAKVGSRSITMEFQSVNPLKALLASPPNSKPFSLFAMEASGSSSDGGNGEGNSDLDYDKFNSKNKSRKKFGLKALTEEEFVELEAAVQELDTQQRAKQSNAAASAATTAAELSKQSAGKKNNFFETLFGNVMKDTCESNYDCERPEVCCDFGFQKRCCSSGQMVIDQMRGKKLTMIPLPVVAEWPPGQFPPETSRPNY